MIILYPGAPGAFAHAACALFRTGAEPAARPTARDVAIELAAGKADTGVLPFSNSIAGPVPGIDELIDEFSLCIEDRAELPIRLHLMSVEGTTFEHITTVVSHPIALKQCARKLSELRLRLVEASSTAQAARDLERISVAALASERAAKVYGRVILVRDLQDEPDSRTMFILVRRSS